MNKEEMEKKIFELICVNEQLQQENKQLKEKYEKAIKIISEYSEAPCELIEENIDEKYCEEKCSDGYKACWKHYIENCYKGENNEN